MFDVGAELDQVFAVWDLRQDGWDNVEGAMRPAGVCEANSFESPRVEDIKTRLCRCWRGMRI